MRIRRQGQRGHEESTCAEYGCTGERSNERPAANAAAPAEPKKKFSVGAAIGALLFAGLASPFLELGTSPAELLVGDSFCRHEHRVETDGWGETGYRGPFKASEPAATDNWETACLTFLTNYDKQVHDLRHEFAAWELACRNAMRWVHSEQLAVLRTGRNNLKRTRILHRRAKLGQRLLHCCHMNRRKRSGCERICTAGACSENGSRRRNRNTSGEMVGPLAPIAIFLAKAKWLLRFQV